MKDKFYPGDEITESDDEDMSDFSDSPVVKRVGFKV